MKNGRLLATPAQPDVYEGPTYPAHIQMMEMKPSYVDIVAIVVANDNTAATLEGTASIRVSVLNRHPSADWTAKFNFADFGKSSVEQCCICISPIPGLHESVQGRQVNILADST